MRIYRDIRFSKNKQPYKTNIAAWWARQGLEKTSGGGFYFELNETEVRIAAGVYMPERDQLLAIRRMLLERHLELRDRMGKKQLKGKLTPFDGLKMTRGPKGFPPTIQPWTSSCSGSGASAPACPSTRPSGQGLSGK